MLVFLFQVKFLNYGLYNPECNLHYRLYNPDEGMATASNIMEAIPRRVTRSVTKKEAFQSLSLFSIS